MSELEAMVKLFGTITLTWLGTCAIVLPPAGLAYVYLTKGGGRFKTGNDVLRFGRDILTKVDKRQLYRDMRTCFKNPPEETMQEMERRYDFLNQYLIEQIQ
ncbi:MAG: hypothetical protein KKC19_03170 [Nanoarchaeota archaeon]|nr:hypothetical protein [Nanoarchaeota archaeon]